MNIDVHSTAWIAPTASITPSVRNTRIIIGADSKIFEFVVVRCVGGSGDIVIGERVYINPHCVLYSGNGILIGDDTLIAAGTCIMPANHKFSDISTPIRAQGFAESKGGAIIGRDVWIGANVTILDGAVIGDGAVIAAGAVVTGPVDSLSIVSGVPARVIGRRGADRSGR